MTQPTITPLTNRLLIRPKKAFDPKIPDFVIPPAAQGDEPTEGEIISLGQRRDAKGRELPWDIQVGQRIHFRLYAQAPIHGTDLAIIKDSDVLGIVTDAPKWTTELPNEDGHYWHRQSADCEPSIVELDTEKADPDLVWITKGDESLMHLKNEVEGEFWPVRITPPPA